MKKLKICTSLNRKFKSNQCTGIMEYLQNKNVLRFTLSESFDDILKEINLFVINKCNTVYLIIKSSTY